MKFLKPVAAIVCMLAVPELALAQADGKISGTVRDQTNAFVAGAKVTAKNERTGEERTTVTNDQGSFLLSYLKPSTYTIRAERPGFATIEYPRMVLAVGQELALDFELPPAGVQEAVTVTAAAPVLDISSARMGVNVGEREVNSLPVNGRQMSQLMLQAPGATNAGSGTWSDIHFSGRAVEQNAIRYDGIEGSSIIDASPGQSNGEIATPFKLQASLENVQEFRVESSNYPAEYGTGTGGQVNVVTKSGGNDFHGAAFEYLRNDALDAPNYFETTASGLKQGLQPSLSQHQFGGSIGGPIAKDRAFFFGSYRGLPARRRAEPHRGGSERRGVGDRRCLAVLPLRPGFTGAGCVPPAWSVEESAARHLPVAGRAESHRDGVQRPLRLQTQRQMDMPTSARSTTRARATIPKRSPDGSCTCTDNPTNAVFNLQAVVSDRTINEFKFGYNAAPTQVNGVLAESGHQRNRLLEPHHQHQRIGGQQRHRRPGHVDRSRDPRRPGPRQQLDQRSRSALRSVLTVVHRLDEHHPGNSLPEGRRRVSEAFA